jgi:hypothetical protein
MMNHPMQCRCGNLKGHVSHPGQALNRAICYCKDCQAYAHFLGRAGDVLDDAGGTEVIAILPRHLSFTHGIDALACMSLTQNGLLRWHARCCNTPIGNTSRNAGLPFVGLVHVCLQNPTISLDQSFGPVGMWVNTSSARRQPVSSKPLKTTAAILRFLARMLRARVDGSHRITPFFDPDRRVPVVAPQVLSAEERGRLMQAVQSSS